MRKPKRKEIVLSILRLMETTKPPKKIYGYFTRRQLIELHTYLLLKREDSKEIYTNAKTIYKRINLLSNRLTPEVKTLLDNIIRLSAVYEGRLTHENNR